MPFDDPRNLEEAVAWLEAWLANHASLLEFRDTPEEKLFRYHHGLGREVRNRFRLWHQERPALWHWFDSELKIDHPDDMSSIIITSLHRRLNGKPLDVAAQVCRFHEYWAAYSSR